MATVKKSLGRGLAALIPENDMEMLRKVARGQESTPSKTDKPLRGSALRESKKSALTISPSAIQTPDSIQQKSVSHQRGARAELASDSPQGGAASGHIEVNSIVANPYQPRRFFQPDELEDLASSIREHGVLQPIIVRPLKSSADGAKYQLVAGERRWRASQIAGLIEVPAIVRLISDQQALELALIENVQRHDISAVDAALAYKRLSQEFSLSQEDIAKRVGKSRSAVANTLRLLDLSDEIRGAIEKAEISEGHGRAILLASGEGARRALFRRIKRDNLSVREVERLAKLTEESIEGTEDGSLIKDKKAMSPETQRIEQALTKRLGTRVAIRTRSRGGRILIEYSSVEELQRIMRILNA